MGRTDRHLLGGVKDSALAVPTLVGTPMGGLRRVASVVFRRVGGHARKRRLVIVNALCRFLNCVLRGGLFRGIQVVDRGSDQGVRRLGGTLRIVRGRCTSYVALRSLTRTTNVGSGCFYHCFGSVAREAPISCLGCCQVRRTYFGLMASGRSVTSVKLDYNFGSIDCFVGAFGGCGKVAPGGCLHTPLWSGVTGRIGPVVFSHGEESPCKSLLFSCLVRS